MGEQRNCRMGSDGAYLARLWRFKMIKKGARATAGAGGSWHHSCLVQSFCKFKSFTTRRSLRDCLRCCCCIYSGATLRSTVLSPGLQARCLRAMMGSKVVSSFTFFIISSSLSMSIPVPSPQSGGETMCSYRQG